jgi:lysophospholipase L1-like esterase
MNYVESFNLFGMEAAQIPCIRGNGAPATTTEGAVGCLYMDTASESKDLYKCTAVADGTYTWVILSSKSDNDDNENTWVDITAATTTLYNTAGTEVGEGVININSNYVCQKVNVSAGDKFRITGSGGNGYRLWAFTDTEGVILDGYRAGVNATRTDEIIIAPVDGCLYVAFHKTSTPYSLYQQKSLILELVESNQRKIEDIIRSNVLYGKKYVAAGDSYTAWSDATYADGVYGGQFVTYDREIRLRNGMSGDNAGISGSTMTYMDGESIRSFSGTRYTEIPEGTDYLTIAFGINDSSSRPLGELGDTENTTFYGAWDKVLKYYAENRPEMKIGIICFARSNNSFYNAVKEIAKHYGVPLLDFYGGEDTPMYVDGKACNPYDKEKPNPIVDPKRAYWGGHANVDKTEETFRGKTYTLRQPSTDEAFAAHPGYKAHIDESTIIESFLRRL